jgi:hypothetical protein
LVLFKASNVRVYSDNYYCSIWTFNEKYPDAFKLVKLNNMTWDGSNDKYNYIEL